MPSGVTVTLERSGLGGRREVPFDIMDRIFMSDSAVSLSNPCSLNSSERLERKKIMELAFPSKAD